MMKCVVFLAVLGFVSGCPERRAERRASVAFTALLSKDTAVGAYAVVKYDYVLTNWGGAYQPTTGVFTAPYNGLYSISCSLVSRRENYVYLGIMKNVTRLTVVFSTSKTYPQPSQTLQLLLNKGDRIWIRNNHNNVAKFRDFKMYNVFSGFLIDEL